MFKNLKCPKHFVDRRNRPEKNEITEGKVIEISADAYHDPKNPIAARTLSRSELVSFQDSPEAFYHKKLLGEDPGDGSDAIRFGKCWHAMTLESKETFAKVRASDLTKNGQRRGKAWDEFVEEHGTWYLLDREYETAKRMRDAVLANPIYRDFCLESRFIPDLQHELSIEAVHEPTGIGTRIRLDVFSATLFDLKSCANVAPQQFGNHALSFGYQQQAALYTDVVRAMTGEGIDRRFGFVACQKKFPHTVEVYVMDDEFVSLGRRMNYRAFDLFAAFWEMHTARVEAGHEDGVVWQPATYGQAVTLRMPGRGMYVEDYLPDPNDYIKQARAIRGVSQRDDGSLTAEAVERLLDEGRI